jgi:hypothetical protein
MDGRERGLALLLGRKGAQSLEGAGHVRLGAVEGTVGDEDDAEDVAQRCCCCRRCCC